MKPWTIEFTDNARKQLKKLDRREIIRITSFLKERVEKHPSPCEMAKRLRGELGDYWRFRVGDHRIICEIQENILLITVIQIGHRRQIYT
jgi:mRNA interferase RelE/StbE